jgi:HK97 family phage major capsid protein
MTLGVKELEKQVDELAAKGVELEAKLAQATGTRAVPKIDGETFERKIRFEGPDGSAGNRDRVFGPKPQRDPSFEEVALLRSILGKRGSVLPDDLEARFQAEAKKYTLTTTDAGAGEELVPTAHWPQLWQDAALGAKVAALFYPPVPMTTKSLELPELGDAVFYRPGGEGQSVTATTPSTAKRTLTACALKAQVDVSDELNDDGVVAMIPAIRAALVRNAAEAIDEAVLNADTTTGKQNINYYAATGGSDIGTDSRFLLGFNGLLHYALVELTGQKSDVGTLEVGDFTTLMGLLGKYADDSQRCGFIVDRWAHLKMLTLDDFLTVDKMGPQATLLTGQVGSLFGIAVVKSGQLAKSNATGQVDQTSGSNTKGRIVLVNRDMWRFGLRKVVSVSTERSESKGMTSVVGVFRIALQCFGDRSDAKYCHTALGYDITI